MVKRSTAGGGRVIENPIINSPYLEPDRHFRFDEDGITNEKMEGRRRDQPNPWPRGDMAPGGYPGVTRTTRRLLEYWTNPERENKLLFGLPTLCRRSDLVTLKMSAIA